MSKVLKRRLSYALRGLVVGTLAALTVVVVSPGFARADGCSQGACTDRFGPCKKCTGAWEGYNGEYSGCAGNSCYYTCGSSCTILEEET